ncbi:hypothetical protein HY450_03515 [Candidatus Pacearchaeota archaeon]|nr:hypothetical protein [Candidatus Pacearchaeota archaeon]
MTETNNPVRSLEELFRNRKEKCTLLERRLKKIRGALRKTENTVKVSKKILTKIRQSRAYSDGVNRIMALMDGSIDESYSNPEFYRVLDGDPVHQKLESGFLGFYGNDWRVAPSADTSLRLMMRYRQMPEELYRAIESDDIDKTRQLYDCTIEGFHDFCVKNVWWVTFGEDLE